MALHQAVLRCKVTAHVAAYPTAAPPRSAAPGRPCCTVSPWKETLGLGGRALAELHPEQLTASMLVLALERMLKEAEVLPWSAPWAQNPTPPPLPRPLRLRCRLQTPTLRPLASGLSRLVRGLLSLFNCRPPEGPKGPLGGLWGAGLLIHV